MFTNQLRPIKDDVMLNNLLNFGTESNH